MDPNESRHALRRALDETVSGLASAEELLPHVYRELRRLAAAQLRHERTGITLNATALVHEAYLRVAGDEDPGWNGRGHFFGAAAQAMRRILVESARRKRALRHGGGQQRVDLAELDLPAPRPEEDLLAVDEALARLTAQDARKGKILELRYFGGLNAEETASVVGISVATLERDWKFIKAWLRAALDSAES